MNRTSLKIVLSLEIPPLPQNPTTDKVTRKSKVSVARSIILEFTYNLQWRIQDFPEEWHPSIITARKQVWGR